LTVELLDRTEQDGGIGMAHLCGLRDDRGRQVGQLAEPIDLCGPSRCGVLDRSDVGAQLSPRLGNVHWLKSTY
jgi:hypothetical protein